MAIPTDFPEGYNPNFTWVGNGEEVADLAVIRTDAGSISCWQLTADEMRAIQYTGKIYLMTMGNSSPPLAVSGHIEPLLQMQPLGSGQPKAFADEVVPFQPEDMNRLKARFESAINHVSDEKCLIDRAHYFDLVDGYRLCVFAPSIHVGEYGQQIKHSRQVIHVMASAVGEEAISFEDLANASKRIFSLLSDGRYGNPYSIYENGHGQFITLIYRYKEAGQGGEFDPGPT